MIERRLALVVRPETRGGLPVSFAHHFRIAVVALSASLLMTSVGAACPDCQDEQCTPFPRVCICVPRIGCKIPILILTPQVPLAPFSPIALPAPIQAEFGSMEKLGHDTFTNFQNAGGETIRTLQKAGGDAFATIQKAGEDSIKTTYKAAGDATATYVKAWRDIGDQGKRSFNDAIDAAKAASHYVENQAKAEMNEIQNAEKRVREGKIVDSMWGLATFRRKKPFLDDRATDLVARTRRQIAAGKV
jgi:hypothetical protein